MQRWAGRGSECGGVRIVRPRARGRRKTSDGGEGEGDGKKRRERAKAMDASRGGTGAYYRVPLNV